MRSTAQVLDCANDNTDGMVDIGIRGGVAEAHAQRAVAPSTLYPHGSQHV
jgi:hypothetical protein